MEIDYEKQKVVLVDTPGFDDTHTSDTKVLNMIANWLKDTSVFVSLDHEIRLLTGL